jgi:hypothetical protein
MLWRVTWAAVASRRRDCARSVPAALLDDCRARQPALASRARERDHAPRAANLHALPIFSHVPRARFIGAQELAVAVIDRQPSIIVLMIGAARRVRATPVAVHDGPSRSRIRRSPSRSRTLERMRSSIGQGAVSFKRDQPRVKQCRRRLPRGITPATGRRGAGRQAPTTHADCPPAGHDQPPQSGTRVAGLLTTGGHHSRRVLSAFS